LDQQAINTQKKFEQSSDKIQSQKVYLEAKIETIAALEDKFN